MRWWAMLYRIGATSISMGGVRRRHDAKAGAPRPPCSSDSSTGISYAGQATKIVQGWPKLWANFRARIGIFSQSVGPSLTIWANPIKILFGSTALVWGGRQRTSAPSQNGRPSPPPPAAARPGGAAAPRTRTARPEAARPPAAAAQSTARAPARDAARRRRQNLQFTGVVQNSQGGPEV
jgi:hypothetical protein